MSYAKHVILLLGIAILVPIGVSYAEDDGYYEKMLEKTGFLNSSLKNELKTKIANSWNATSQPQQDAIKSILNSINQLEEIHEQKSHPELADPLQDLRNLLIRVKTISDVTEHQNEIRDMESAVVVLNHARQVSEMLRYNEILDSKIYLHGVWEPIKKKIHQSETTDGIMSFQTDIKRMEEIINYNYQVYENTHSPVFTLVIPNTESVWDSFKDEMSQAASVIEMTDVATEYHRQVGQIDGSIISKWEEKIISLEEVAKRQGNAQDHMRIEQNIKNLNMVKKIEKNADPFDSDAQSKAILHSISQNYLKIKSDLKEFGLYLDNKSRMEQKITDLQNKASDTSAIEKMPEFEPKIKDALHRASHITGALQSDDFKYVQQMIDAIEQEWINFDRFYPEIRNYKPVYKQPAISTADKKQIYLDEISQMHTLIQSLDVNHASPGYQKYQKLMRESKASILYGNFDVGHKKIYQAIDFASQNLLSHDPRIIMDVIHDADSNMLTVNGAVYKHSMNSRDRVLFYLFDQDSQVLEVGSRTTTSGDFQILLNGDIRPGIYVAQIHHGTAKESQIISVQDGSLQDMVFNQAELSIMELANTFESLESFVTTFDDSVSEGQLQKIQLLIGKIKRELADGQIKEAAKSIQKFKNGAKLYVPISSPGITIDASTTDDTVKISGKTAKLVQHREPIFLTVFDQEGKRVHEQMAYDDIYGNINIEIPTRMFKGLTVVQVEYHDFMAREIVEVGSFTNLH